MLNTSSNVFANLPTREVKNAATVPCERYLCKLIVLLAFMICSHFSRDPPRRNLFQFVRPCIVEIVPSNDRALPIFSSRERRRAATGACGRCCCESPASFAMTVGVLSLRSELTARTWRFCAILSISPFPVNFDQLLMVTNMTTQLSSLKRTLRFCATFAAI